MKRLLPLLLVLLTAGVARGQVMQISGGDSTLFQAAGGSLTAYFPNDTATIGGGIIDGHVVEGFTFKTEWHGWILTAGDSPFGFQIPGSGIYAAQRGVSAARKWKNGELTIFTGATGNFFSPMFFSAMQPKHFGAGVYYRRQLGPVNWYSMAVLDGSLHTIMEGADWKWKRMVEVQGSAGLLQNHAFLDAQFNVQPTRWLAASASHQTFVGTTTLSVDSVGVSLQIGDVGAHGSIFAGNRTSGEDVGASFRRGMFDFHADYFTSRFSSNVSSSVGERITQKIRVAQFVNTSNGHWSFSGGFDYVSNRFSIGLSQSTYFMPEYTSRSPFQQALSVTLTVQLPHGSTFNGMTSVDPLGHLRFTTSAQTFIQGPFTGGPTGSQQTKGAATHGKYTIAGNVSDKDGPVAGAAVQVGKNIVFTDSSGNFFLHVGNMKSQTLAVLPDQFTAPGTWLLVSAPASATPGTPLAVTVRRAL